MLDNVHHRDELIGLSRRKSRRYEEKTVRHDELDKELGKGWELRRTNKRTARVRKMKTKSKLFEDRVFTLMYRMGFEYLSGDRGASLSIDPDDPKGPVGQIDCVAIDSEVALACECKTSLKPKRDPKFEEKAAKIGGARKRFTDAVTEGFPTPQSKRAYGTVLFVWDVVISNSDRARAKAHNVVVFNEQDVS